MARTAYLRREAYDDIALGGGTAVITTQERVIDGATPPVKQRVTFVHSENLCGVGLASTVLERVISGTATATGERVAV